MCLCLGVGTVLWYVVVCLCYGLVLCFVICCSVFVFWCGAVGFGKMWCVLVFLLVCGCMALCIVFWCGAVGACFFFTAV